MLSGLENMRTRLSYAGGSRQIDRMNEDKLRSLKKALLYSYQSATIRLEDGREFRALINKDKEKAEYEDKIISIPFQDVCLNKPRQGKTSHGLETVGLKAGDTFTWVAYNANTVDSYWIIYLQYAEETAYFRGEIRQCNKEVLINGKSYRTWFRGPDQQSMEWNQEKDRIVYNKFNYTKVMYITKDEQLLGLFKRFEQFYEDENGVLIYNPDKESRPERWEVVAVNENYGEGIIEVYFKEYFGEPIHELEETEPEKTDAPIQGRTEVYPYDFVAFEAESEGEWSVDNDKVEIQAMTPLSCEVYINTGKKGKFTISHGDDSLEVQIKSL